MSNVKLQVGDMIVDSTWKEMYLIFKIQHSIVHYFYYDLVKCVRVAAKDSISIMEPFCNSYNVTVWKGINATEER